MDSIQGRPDAHLIQTVLLRSLSQALYSANNLGHFGLAFPAYTHFTSPIRRYPDLIVHRAIRHLLSGAKKEEFTYSVPELQGLGDHCSSTERRADEATRDAVDWLKCEYMMDKVGEEYSGIISGVNSFGLFVELADIYATGLIHITALENDFYHFDPIGHRLTGERSGRVYRLGRSRGDSLEADEGTREGTVSADQPAASGPKKSDKRKRRKAKSRGAAGKGHKGKTPKVAGGKSKEK